MGDETLLDVLRLNFVSGVGPRLQTVLLERFGDPGRILAASGRELLDVPGIGPKLSAEITRARTDPAATEELRRCRERGIELLLRGRAGYPAPLDQMPDPPPVLYCRGTYLPQDRLGIALVGSRHGTLYGRQTAERLASALARAGFTIISGLARGIDAAAHRAALAAGGRTIAVCATGLATIYPPEHAGLADEITRQGAVLSESPLDRGPSRGLFPQRNRIISGLSLGVVIVEAGARSGALHTARHAHEQNREVFAVPGRIDNPESLGCHNLIRDGATLVRSVDDILEQLGPLPQPVVTAESQTVLTPRELTLNDQERAVLDLVTLDPLLVDDVLRQCELEAPRVLSTLTVLEMKRLVRRLPGGMIVRVSH
jgi:DNA processing protein